MVVTNDSAKVFNMMWCCWVLICLVLVIPAICLLCCVGLNYKDSVAKAIKCDVCDNIKVDRVYDNKFQD